MMILLVRIKSKMLIKGHRSWKGTNVNAKIPINWQISQNQNGLLNQKGMFNFHFLSNFVTTKLTIVNTECSFYNFSFAIVHQLEKGKFAGKWAHFHFATGNVLAPCWTVNSRWFWWACNDDNGSSGDDDVDGCSDVEGVYSDIDDDDICSDIEGDDLNKGACEVSHPVVLLLPPSPEETSLDLIVIMVMKIKLLFVLMTSQKKQVSTWWWQQRYFEASPEVHCGTALEVLGLFTWMNFLVGSLASSFTTDSMIY